MSIWPQAMSYLRPSSDVDLVRPGDRVLGRGVGRRVRPRRVRRDRAVVDDPAAARVWLFIILNASCVHRKTPVRLMSTTVFHCSKVRSSRLIAGRADAGVVEQHVEAAEGLAWCARTGRCTDAGSAHVGRHRQRAPAGGAGLGDRLLQRLAAAAGERPRGSRPCSSASGDGLADAGAGAGDDGDFGEEVMVGRPSVEFGTSRIVGGKSRNRQGSGNSAGR